MAGIREARVGAASWANIIRWRALVLVGLAMAVAATPAWAATTATTAAATSTTPTSSSSPAGSLSPTPPASTTTTTAPGRDDRPLAGLALLFGLVAAGGVLLFVRDDRAATLKTYEKLVKSGATVQVIQVSAQDGAGVAIPGAAEAEIVPGPQVTIDGPDIVVVGKPAEFVAKNNDGGQVVATWTADPADATEPLGEPTSRLTLTATQSGTFSLTASAAGAAAIPKHVTATVADVRGQPLPFVGAGWGSIVVVIVIAAVTGALGLSGQLNGEAVATILGTLAGYAVAKGQAESASRPATGSDPAAGKSGTTGSHGS
jgi:hypothetical protein